MDDQVRYEQKRYDKLKDAILQEESEEVYLFQPKITQKSIDILNKSMNSSKQHIYLDRSKDDYLMQKELNKATFKPKINESSKKIKRSTNDLLQDAERRKN